MVKIRKNKKGVSPLIATVLLIAFAVALGAVVMNWGRGYVEDTANVARERSDTEVKCASDVGIEVVEIDSVPQICYNQTSDPSNLSIILENKKSTVIQKVQARLIGNGNRVPFISDLGYNSNLSINQAKFLSFAYNSSTYGTPQQVQLTPYIKVGAVEVACPSTSAVIIDIKPCTEIWT
jgi:flagellin-like protein